MVFAKIEEDRGEEVLLILRKRPEVRHPQDPITETYESAEAAFIEAAPSPAAAAEIDTLFTGSEVGCTRGSV